MSTTPVKVQNSSDSKLSLRFQIAAWSLTIAVSIVAIIAWAHDYNGQFSPLTAYVLFPLLGILAYSIMWSHYVSGTVRELLGVEPKSLVNYFRYTGYAVLLLICLHPGLLILQRFRDGFGFPPHSYESYVAPGLGWVTLLGTVSFFVFIAYEFHRKFGDRPWWHFVQDAGDFAMLAIFYHGLRLGGQLTHDGWFRTVWIFYGLILVAILIRKYYIRFITNKRPAKNSVKTEF